MFLQLGWKTLNLHTELKVNPLGGKSQVLVLGKTIRSTGRSMSLTFFEKIFLKQNKILENIHFFTANISQRRHICGLHFAKFIVK